MTQHQDDPHMHGMAQKARAKKQSKLASEPDELYNLAADIGEITYLADKEIEPVAALKSGHM